MIKKPNLHSFVTHKVSRLKAQIYKYYVDNDKYVGVIVLPQDGVIGKQRFQKWRISEIEI
jgi:hypothetical protein